MITALFAFIFFLISNAQAQENKTPATTSLLPQTVFVTMVANKDENNEAERACGFVSRHLVDLHYLVANYCGVQIDEKDQPMPRPGDPAVFLVFADSPVDAKALMQGMPSQALTDGGSSVIVISALFATEGNTGITEGTNRVFFAAMNMPGGPATMAKVVTRCMFEVPTGGVSFEEATQCWGRLHIEDTGAYTLLEGGWDSVLNGTRLIYPPRVPPTESETSRTARALRQYDAQRPKLKASVDPPEAIPSEPLTVPPAATPSSNDRSWSTPKIVLTTAGATTTVATGIALVTVYVKAGALAEDISAGEYGVAGDSRLTAAAEEYNRLGSMAPWLWAGMGAGVVLSGTGIVLPTPHNSTVEATVSVSPSGLMFTGTF